MQPTGGPHHHLNETFALALDRPNVGRFVWNVETRAGALSPSRRRLCRSGLAFLFFSTSFLSFLRKKKEQAGIFLLRLRPWTQIKFSFAWSRKRRWKGEWPLALWKLVAKAFLVPATVQVRSLLFSSFIITSPTECMPHQRRCFPSAC